MKHYAGADYKFPISYSEVHLSNSTTMNANEFPPNFVKMEQTKGKGRVRGRGKAKKLVLT
jgi:hypothetical protein